MNNCGQQQRLLLKQGTRFLPISLSPQGQGQGQGQGLGFCVGHENLFLHFYGDREIVHGSSSSCGGLLYFDSHDNEIVVLNPTTKQFKYITPIGQLPPPRIALTEFGGSGFGYDPKSDDYKVVKLVNHYYGGDIDYNEGDIDYNGGDIEESDSRAEQYTESRAEVYSLKSNSWKEIPTTPHLYTSDCVFEHNTYISGMYYWMRCRVLQSGYHQDVVSFDFAHETFSSFPLPLPPLQIQNGLVVYDYKLVEFHGLLGVIAYECPNASKRFQLWERRAGWWAKVFDVVLLNANVNVERPVPVGLKDGRFLFLQVKGKAASSSHLCEQLVVYDWITKEFHQTMVYDYPKHPRQMELLSYVESRAPLPPPCSYIPTFKA